MKNKRINVLNKLILVFILLLSITSYSQKITRGPDIGEIYFLGPTNTGKGLYYSIDFGENAACVDSIKNFASISADKTAGCIYGLTSPSNLYYSGSYGLQNSWTIRQVDVSVDINSGVTEGAIYNSIGAHSENYGNDFIYHSVNGFFGSLKISEIDNQIGTGYAVTKSSYIPDSVFFLITYDNFENLYIKSVYHNHEYMFNYMARGTNHGEIFTIRNRPFSFDPFEIYHTLSFGDTFLLIDQINFANHYSFGVEGGRQEGELYILYNFVNQMWLNAHTYIFHSTDYGKTFEVFHPFKKGNEPVLANFSSTDNEIQLMNVIEFSNFSIGNIIEYRWDFENDGIVDSYEENPIHTYEDTGYYSVKLSVVGLDSTNTFIKENYIHVIDTITGSQDLNYQTVNISPNPFSDKIGIKTNQDFKMIEIFDLNGKSHFAKTIDQGNRTQNIDLRKLEKGIYILKIRTKGKDITKKIIKI